VRLHLSEEITDLEEAKVFESALRETAKDAKTITLTIDSEASVNKLFPDYLIWYRLHRAEKSYKDINSVYENHIKKILGNERIRTLNSGHILLYQQTRKREQARRRVKKEEKRPVSNRTINKELDYLSGFLRWCKEEKYMHLEPIRIKKLPSKRPIPIILSPDEVMRIIDAAEPIYRVFFICLYSLGFRFSEARFLKWEDVDFANGLIRVTQKGGSDKVLPLSDWLAAELKTLRPQEEQSGYIFISKRSGKPIINVRNAIARACKKAGVTKSVNPHLFRHSIATHFVSDGANLRTIQKYLGHTQIETTEWYTHIVAEHLKTAAEKLFSSNVHRKTVNK
jgi:integrase